MIHSTDSFNVIQNLHAHFHHHYSLQNNYDDDDDDDCLHFISAH